MTDQKIQRLKHVSSVTPRWDILAGCRGIFHLLDCGIQVFEPTRDSDSFHTGAGWWIHIKECECDVFLAVEELDFHDEFQWAQFVKSQKKNNAEKQDE